MKAKIIYTLDKTKDEDLEYANLLDAMIFAVNIAKSRGDTDVPSFEYNIVDDVETMISEYSFEMNIDMTDQLFKTDEIKKVLANFMGGL